jgi:lipopolysaccharide export system protein LptC
MKNFTVERFAKDGRLKLRIQGDALRHYPDTERTEIDGASIRAIAPDGRATVARARMAVTNRDGSEVQLLGGARVTGVGRGGEPIEFEGEFLHAFLTPNGCARTCRCWCATTAASSAPPQWTTTI